MIEEQNEKHEELREDMIAKKNDQDAEINTKAKTSRKITSD